MTKKQAAKLAQQSITTMVVPTGDNAGVYRHDPATLPCPRHTAACWTRVDDGEEG